MSILSTLKPLKEITTIEYINIFDVFSYLGGNYVSLAAILITLPTALFFNREYVNKYILNRLRQIEELKDPKFKMTDNQLKKKYFYRVSHTSLY